MRVKQKINNWIIKEKRADEVPASQPLERRCIVFTPDGRCMEDNLTYEEAIEFCQENLDFVKRQNK